MLILKNADNYPSAKRIFKDVEIEITSEGKRHLGAALGSEQFKEEYVKLKVSKWVKDIEKLAEFAQQEPQAALCAFTKGLCHRWTYIQRTVSDISRLFEPLESAIRTKLLKEIIGRDVSDIERRLLALPVRMGGLGVRNPVETSQKEYEASVQITKQLTDKICRQDQDITTIDWKEVKTEKENMTLKRNLSFKTEQEAIIKELKDETVQDSKAASEKGASAWLSALPLKKLGYALNKREFQDALKLRYGWSIPDMPRYCACSKRNSTDHALDCKLGGYVHIRHNNIRDAEAKIMKEVAYDEKIEPQLQPVSKPLELTKGSNTADNARLDVSARGIFCSFENTFFDVRITNPNSTSQQDKTLPDIYKKHKKEKMTAYNDRILQAEKASFVPLVYTTTGGMGPQCTAFHKQLAQLIADKRHEKYSDVMNHMRTRLRFALLRSILIAVRGSRGKKHYDRDLSEVAFNLIPHEISYESY